jgi:hypothetical protein
LGNLRAIASLFPLLWKRFASFDGVAELSPEDLDDLWYRWLAPFVGTGEGDGWLDREGLVPAQLARYFGSEFVENVTTLCWLAVRQGRDRRQRVIMWQPTLQAAFDRGLIDVTNTVVADIGAVVGQQMGAEQLRDDLLNCLTFLDDPLWCERTAKELALDSLALEAVHSGQAISVHLKVQGIENPLYDLRVPKLILAARRYRGTDSIGIFSGDGDWRLVVSDRRRHGAPVVYLPSLRGEMVESAPLAANAIQNLAVSQGVVANLLPQSAMTA